MHGDHTRAISGEEYGQGRQGLGLGTKGTRSTFDALANALPEILAWS